MSKARDEARAAYEAESLTDLLDLRFNGSYVAGVIEEVILAKAEDLQATKEV